jgi:hypothetical protein
VTYLIPVISVIHSSKKEEAMMEACGSGASGHSGMAIFISHVMREDMSRHFCSCVLGEKKNLDSVLVVLIFFSKRCR